MATVTAQLTVGTAHPNDGGVIPTHLLQLHENSKPRWTLTALQADVPAALASWVPSRPETILADGLLMAVLLVVQDAAVQALAPDALKGEDEVVLGEAVDAAVLEKLHAACRSSKTRFKVVFTALEGSTLHQQLGQLAGYCMDLEVCVPVFSRCYSESRGETVVRGSLAEARRGEGG